MLPSEQEPALPSASKGDNSCSKAKKKHHPLIQVRPGGLLLFPFPKKHSGNDAWLHQLDGNALISFSQSINVWGFYADFSLEVFFSPGSFFLSHKRAVNEALKFPCPSLTPCFLPSFSTNKNAGRNFFHFHVLCVRVNSLFRCLQKMGGFRGWGGFFLGMGGSKGKLERLSSAEAKRNYFVPDVSDGQGASASSSLHTTGSFIAGFLKFLNYS